MWAVQPRYERDMPAFLDRAGALGFRAVELNHSMDLAMARAALAAPFPVTAVHAPAPLERDPLHGWNRGLNLAALDEAERTAAVGFTVRSIELAREAGARWVVVHLGAVGDAPLAGERELRALYERGERPGTGTSQASAAWRAAEAALRRERAALAPDYLRQAARSLETLCEHAARAGVTIGLECRLHAHEIPWPTEAARLLAPYPPTVAGYWHDVGHAEVLDRLGLVPLRSWFRLVGGERLVGTHLHDVARLVDHRAIGNGTVDFPALAPLLPAAAARTFEIDQREADDALAAGIGRLREAGILH